MATLLLAAGRPDYDWQFNLQKILANGFAPFGVTGATSITITCHYMDSNALLRTLDLVLTGSGIDTSNTGVITAGTITSFEIREIVEGGPPTPQTILQMSGLTGFDAVDLQTAINGADGLDPYGEPFRASVAPMFQSEAVNATGSAGGDSIFGSEFVDTVLAGDGNDYLRPGNGVDAVTGGLGFDVLDYRYDSRTVGIIADLLAQTVIDNDGGNTTTDTISGIEGIGGSDKNDILRGHSNRDELFGNAGNDLIEGRGGDDTIGGGSGDDTLDGGASVSDWDMLTYANEGGPSGVDVTWNAGTNSTGTVRDTFGNQDIFLNIEVVAGSDQRDMFVGNSGNNQVEGNRGGDFFAGGAGTDTFHYENERWRPAAPLNGIVVNLEIATDGADIIGRGTDSFGTFDYYENVENIVGTDFNDTIRGSSVTNRLEGRNSDDTLSGMGGNDFLFGDDGIDTLDGGAGADALNGGNGNDIASYHSASAGVVAVMGSTVGAPVKAGDAAGDTYDNMENLRGSNFTDTLWGNTGANFIEGLVGNDTLNGRQGADTLIGGDGNDTYVIDRNLDGADDTVTEAGTVNAGTADLVQFTGTAAGQMYTLGSNVENLTLLGAFATNGTGNGLANIFVGNGAMNAFTGGDGNDIYRLQNQTDTAIEGNGLPAGGDDLVEFTAPAAGQTFTIGANVERLTLLGAVAVNGTGNASGNTLTGNAFANTLNGMAGVDTMIGGDGNDIFVADMATDIATETNAVLATGGDDLVQYFGAVGTTFVLGANVERLTLSNALATNGTGNASANTITGNAANNILNGRAGLDILIGLGGDDIYVIDRTVDGATTDTVTEAAGAGTDTVQFTGTAAGQSYTLGLNVENLVLLGAQSTNGVGNAGNNVFTGNTNLNNFNGGDGNDTYNLQNFTDTVTETNALATGGTLDTVVFTGTVAAQTYTLGATNVERLFLGGGVATNATGNGLANTIVGNGANNVINGGLGLDMLQGGLGNDAFAFNSALGATNKDAILDFNVVADTVQLENLIFAGLVGANNTTLTANQFNTNNNNGLALDADDRIIYDKDSGQLWYDSNGNAAGGTIVNFASITANLVLTNADFFII